jgi:hypothetical protein
MGLTQSVHATMYFSLQIGGNVDLDGSVLYQAMVFPSLFPGPETGFQTGRVESADHTLGSFTDGQNAWVEISPIVEFKTKTDLMSALNQAFTFTLDQGLATERRYTMLPNIANLNGIDLTPPAISYPQQGAVMDTLTPTFSFALPTIGTSYLQMYHCPAGEESGFVGDASITLPPGTTSWSPTAPLVPNASYYIDIYARYYTSNCGFTVPVDSQGTAFPDCKSGAMITLESIHAFTTVPEPGTLGLLATGGLLLMRRRKHTHS